jgi:hypothetical protein
MIHSFSTHEDVAHAFFGSSQEFESNDEPMYEIETDMVVDLYPVLSNTILINEAVQYLCDSCSRKNINNTPTGDE